MIQFKCFILLFYNHGKIEKRIFLFSILKFDIKCEKHIADFAIYYSF